MAMRAAARSSVVAVWVTLGLLPVPGAGAHGGGTAEPPESVFAPAGEFCPSFDVTGDFSHPFRGSQIMFKDGRDVTHGVGTGTWTNAETGESFVQRSRYMLVERYVEEANDVQVEITGRFMIGFLPGDIGLDGSVVPEISTYSVVGHQTFTLDLDTFLITAYALDGQVIADICAVLAG